MSISVQSRILALALGALLGGGAARGNATLTVRPNDGAGTVVELTLPATPEAVGIRGVA